MSYTLFRTTYTDRKTGEQRQSPTLHVHFRDHLRRRQKFTGGRTEKQGHHVGGMLTELVECRKTGADPSERLRRWLGTLPDGDRGRLETMDLLDAQAAGAGKPLTVHLEGEKDAAGNVVSPGYRQALAARGVTEHHVHTTVKRVADTFAGCGFTHWRDLVKPGAAARIEVWLGEK